MMGEERCAEVTWPRDGRQSPAALDIQRGLIRLFAAHGVCAITELPLANGLRADAVGLASDGEVWIAEIKSCLNDFRADAKWPGYLDFCDRFYFAVAPDFPLGVLPAEVGVILADRYGGEFMRAAAATKLAAARRKALTLRFGRAAAARLARAADPELMSKPGRLP